ncbi:hypothetical protein GGI12_001929 [Dipsacomyces acuminosporus]|nr:hypothetical protein GGI12_001929 [Dipsacomyces acuminosporus]
MQSPTVEGGNAANSKPQLEEFPQLNETEALEAQLPPPYSLFDQANTSFSGAVHPDLQQQQQQQQQQAEQGHVYEPEQEQLVVEHPSNEQYRTTEHTVQPPPPNAPFQGAGGNGLLSISQDEYYHPASFPGYTVVRLANGEQEALLRRANTYQGDLRYISSPFGNIDCSILKAQKDFYLDFPTKQPLHIESAEGITVTDVRFVRYNNTSLAPHISRKSMYSGELDPPVIVHMVVETTSPRWMDLVAINHVSQPGTDQPSRLAIKAIYPGWGWWMYDCIRVSLYIGIPELPVQSDAAMPFLQIVTGSGSLEALDVGNLALKTLETQGQNGAIKMRSFSVLESLKATTTNGEISVSNVAAKYSIDLTSSNGGVTLDSVSSSVVKAKSTNGRFLVANVSADESHLVTTNSRMNLENIVSDNITARNLNGPIIGNVTTGTSVDVRTINGPIDLHAKARPGTEGRWKEIIARTLNAKASVSLSKITGQFDVSTLNGRAKVTATNDTITYLRNTGNYKGGFYGHEKSGVITISTANDHATLSFVD